jgi:hypothetical protein
MESVIKLAEGNNALLCLMVFGFGIAALWLFKAKEKTSSEQRLEILENSKETNRSIKKIVEKQTEQDIRMVKWEEKMSNHIDNDEKYQERTDSNFSSLNRAFGNYIDKKNYEFKNGGR